MVEATWKYLTDILKIITIIIEVCIIVRILKLKHLTEDYRYLTVYYIINKEIYIRLKY